MVLLLNLKVIYRYRVNSSLCRVRQRWLIVVSSGPVDLELRMRS